MIWEEERGGEHRRRDGRGRGGGRGRGRGAVLLSLKLFELNRVVSALRRRGRVAGITFSRARAALAARSVNSSIFAR